MAEFEDKVELEDVVVLVETEAALLVRLEDGAETWIPLSHVDDDSPCYRKGDTGTLIVSAWIAEKKGLV